MKKFKFRLQKVLDYREVEKRDRAATLAEKNHTLRTLEERFEEIIEEQNTIGAGEDGIVSMGEFMITDEYKGRLQIELEKQRDMILEAAQAVDEAREAYVEKAVETGTLESVKKRRKAEHLEEQAKLEKKALSEMVIQRYGLNRRKDK